MVRFPTFLVLLFVLHHRFRQHLILLIIWLFVLPSQPTVSATPKSTVTTQSSVSTSTETAIPSATKPSVTHESS